MSYTVSIQEGAPERYFDPVAARWRSASSLVQGTELPVSTVWARIEAYVARRWFVRDVEFIAEGDCADWLPDLAPFTATDIERWDGSAWVAATPNVTPLGGWTLDLGTYRFSGTVGSIDLDNIQEKPPGDVREAAKRLALYMGGCNTRPDAGTTERNLSVGVALHVKAPMYHEARALQLSGAGDLLRPYRTVHKNG